MDIFRKCQEYWADFAFIIHRGHRPGCQANIGATEVENRNINSEKVGENRKKQGNYDGLPTPLQPPLSTIFIPIQLIY